MRCFTLIGLFSATAAWAESQPEALELLDQVKAREAELAREVSTIQFRITETKQELDEEGMVEDTEKECRITAPGGETSPANRELEKAEVKDSVKETFSILESSKLFEWQLQPEEKLDGVPCRVLKFEPKEGLDTENQREKVMSQLAGTYWVDAADLSCRQIVGKLTRLVPVLGFVAELRELEFLWKSQDLRERITGPFLVEYRYKATVFPFFTTHERHVLLYEVVR